MTGAFQDDRGRNYKFKADDLVRGRMKGGKPNEFRWKRPSAVLVGEQSVEIDSRWFRAAADQLDVVAEVKGNVPYGVTAGSTLTWYSDPQDMAVLRDPRGRVVGALVPVDDPAQAAGAVTVTAYDDFTPLQWRIYYGVLVFIIVFAVVGVLFLV